MDYKILNIGLPRTGTFSLAIALSILGYNTKHYPHDINLISKYDAACEVVFSYEELHLKFPNSFYIFTNRKFESWIRSCKSHSIHYKNYWNNFWQNSTNWEKIYYKKLDSINYFKNYKNFLILNLEDQNKWEKLCNFLNKPIPQISYPHLNKSYRFFI
jgi:hypothetical protein